ncbi:MAG: formate dehydrogenase accessory sulfurtransferase FdhD [Kineosporiaceae bacterium]|nr:formate dehydrogenase accessory sulfurtransferase FdhD [Kineosporiaceae bacterium]
MTTRRPVLRLRVGAPDGAGGTERADTLAVEEPLEIRLAHAGAPDGEPFTVTMRTPGHDLELALGFLLTDGVISAPGDVTSARHCPDAARDADGNPTHNVVEVGLARHVAIPSRALSRRVSSACGICGTESIEAVRARCGTTLAADDVRLDPAVLAGLPEALRAGQRAFARTGGVHAAGLFTPAGDLLCLREDVGRHNAVDKVVGWALQHDRLPLAGLVLQVSGRASFELAQKAVSAGCPVLAAVSAPSSLAVDLALDTGLTLIGFSRGQGFNIYAGDGRIRR